MNFSISFYKKINLISLIFNLSIPIIFLGLVVFVKNIDPKILAAFRASIGVASLGILYYFIFNKFIEEKTQNTLYGSFFIHYLYFFILINTTGGPVSPLFFLSYFLIIISFFVSILTGVFSFLFSFGYLVFTILIQNRFEISSLTLVLPQVASLLLVSIFSLILGIYYRKNLAEKRRIEIIAEKMSTDKDQEEAILSSITDGIYAVDNERNLVLFNTAAEEMTGWDRKSALGLKCWNVMKLKNEEDISVCEKDCPMLQVWNTGENLTREDLYFINKNKKSVQISGAYSPIKSLSGKLTGGVCVFRDVTKRKEVERLRNEFVSTASHELRTPLTTLEGYIDLASNEKTSKIDEKAREYLTKAHNTVINMSNLVKNLLSVTKIDEGKIELNIEDFSISELIETTVNELRPLAEKKGLKLEFLKTSIGEKGKKALARSINVSADKSIVKEILSNLIENGIKFTTKGGVTVKVNYDNDFAIITVEDTGMGIPPDSIKHLFEKFYRVDNSATREVGGTGLGLYITRSMVELLGGKIWVESKLGKGTAFTFTLPRSLI